MSNIKLFFRISKIFIFFNSVKYIFNYLNVRNYYPNIFKVGQKNFFNLITMNRVKLFEKLQEQMSLESND